MAKVTVCIDVADLEIAARFYVDALGCEKTGQSPANVKLLANGAEIYLILAKPGSAPFKDAAGTRTFSRHWTPVHLDFHTAEFDRTLAGIIEQGGSHEGTQSGDWGSLAHCADPFGNGFCLIAEAG